MENGIGHRNVGHALPNVERLASDAQSFHLHLSGNWLCRCSSLACILFIYQDGKRIRGSGVPRALIRFCCHH